MSRLRFCFAFTLVLLLTLSAAGWAQPPGSSPGEAPPKSLRDAYNRAEHFGDEPAAPATPAAERSRWFDRVHYLGLAGALALLAALGTGLWHYLILAFRAQDRVQVRRRWHTGHAVLGLAAGALALSHVAGRCVQAGEFRLGWGVPLLTAGAIILLVITGLLRVRPPRAPAPYPQFWARAHQALTALAVLFLLWHGLTMYAQFVLHR